MLKVDTIIRNISKLYTVDEKFTVIEDAATAFKAGKIAWIGKDSDYKKNVSAKKVVNAKGMIATPGFIDCHTHLVFAGTREDEYVKRIKGKSYMEIAKEGGGIMASVRKNREASFDELYESGFERLNRILSFGVTTCEIKSGYGLELQTEGKILKVIKRLSKDHAVDLVPTFLGAHEIPTEYKSNRQKYIEIIKKEMIPKFAEEKLAEFCDIFCEEGVYSIDESRDILETAKEYGYKIKLHADEFVDTNGAALAAELGAVSADHLMAANEDGLKNMAEKGVIGVVLPGTSFNLGSTKFAPARKMIELGMKVAIATDFNPGSSMSEFLPLMGTIACNYMKLTPEEVLKGITINAAYAVGREKEIGNLKVGKKADLVLMNILSINYFPYHYGINHVKEVWKSGKRLLYR